MAKFNIIVQFGKDFVGWAEDNFLPLSGEKPMQGDILMPYGKGIYAEDKRAGLYFPIKQAA
jgi:hypothetical protein